MRRNGKQQRGPRSANFFVAAAVLIVCNVAFGFITSWHLAALIVPPLISLITIVLLLLMRARQQKTTRALLDKISGLGEGMEQERKDHTTQSASHPRSGVLRNGQRKDGWK